MSKTPIKMRVRILPDGGTITVTGRDAWALDKLIKAGPAGCTPIEVPGPRWSHYSFKLRKSGLNIETLNERHGGPYPGNHARYVLRSEVAVIEETKSA